MTTSAQLRSALQSSVFSHSSVTAITPKIFSYDRIKKSSSETVDLFHQQRINFIQWTCNRSHVKQVGGGFSILEFVHDLEVMYAVEAQLGSGGYNEVIDGLQTIESRILISTESTNWHNNLLPARLVAVDAPSIVILDSKDCWTGRHRYQFTEIASY